MAHLDRSMTGERMTGFHPSRPFAAVVVKGSFGSRRTEGSAEFPVNLYNQKSHVLSAAMCAVSEPR
jgi:hypothetical protein